MLSSISTYLLVTFSVISLLVILKIGWFWREWPIIRLLIINVCLSKCRFSQGWMLLSGVHVGVLCTNCTCQSCLTNRTCTAHSIAVHTRFAVLSLSPLCSQIYNNFMRCKGVDSLCKNSFVTDNQSRGMVVAFCYFCYSGANVCIVAWSDKIMFSNFD